MRFPGFSGEWEKVKLGNLFDIGSSKRVFESQWRSSGVPFYRTREIVSLINGTPFASPIYIDEDLFKELIEKYGSIEKDDMLVTGVGTIGQMFVVPETNKFYFKDGNVIWFKHNPSISSQFIKQLFSTKSIINQLQNNASITTVATYTIDGAKKTNAFIPSKDEQDKIADFLTLIDQRIAIQNKVIEKYESLIKAICRELFQEGRNRKIRISELGEYFATMNLSKGDLSKEGEECILYGELFTTYGRIISRVKGKTNVVKGATRSCGNDLLFPASTTVDAISLIAPSAIIKERVILGGDMFGIHISSEYDNQYLSYLLYYCYRDLLAGYAQGSTIIHLHYNDIKDVQIAVHDLPMQRKISHLLRLIEDAKECHLNTIERYVSQKNYCLQQLFI